MDGITKFGEDTSPVRCTSIPQVMDTLRNMALSDIRFAGYKIILIQSNISLGMIDSESLDDR